MDGISESLAAAALREQARAYAAPQAHTRPQCAEIG
ncbi:hypothetical protein PVAP13_3NG037689 [Panicum virgatum]|uniref:Uncharacterized protein n=1 Tax=Panicum virgatum TaxID=38727 RepID=A0A8T0U0M5_PANVG|nr:hypothetical protein PVAP13_3NG037689 [Panicum virgatum]